MAAASKTSRIVGRVLTTLLTLFLLFDGATKVVPTKQVLDATARIGYPAAALAGTGIALLVSTVLYVVPQTAVFGTLLLTGYLGGAVATMVIAHAGRFEMFFPVIFGVLVWLSMLLREPRLRNLLPIRSVLATT